MTYVRVTGTHDGLYDITFFTIGKGPQSYDGIHGEMLQEVFGTNVGLFSPDHAPGGALLHAC